MINLDEILNQVKSDTVLNMSDEGSEEMYSEQSVKEAITIAIRKALELAANEAEIDWKYDEKGESIYMVDKRSITSLINKVV